MARNLKGRIPLRMRTKNFQKLALAINPHTTNSSTTNTNCTHNDERDDCRQAGGDEAGGIKAEPKLEETRETVQDHSEKIRSGVFGWRSVQQSEPDSSCSAEDLTAN